MVMDPFAAEDVEPGMSSALHHTDELLGDFASMHEHVKHSMAEEFLQVFELESRGDPEQAFRVKTAVRGQYMQMRMIPVRPLAKGLRGHDRA